MVIGEFCIVVMAECVVSHPLFWAYSSGLYSPMTGYSDTTGIDCFCPLLVRRLLRGCDEEVS